MLTQQECLRALEILIKCFVHYIVDSLILNLSSELLKTVRYFGPSSALYQDVSTVNLSDPVIHCTMTSIKETIGVHLLEISMYESQ